MRGIASDCRLGWPSGLRRLTQVQFSSEAWVRIPLQAVFLFVINRKLVRAINIYYVVLLNYVYNLITLL